MKKKPVTDVAASVRQRLLNLARSQKEDFGILLSRYAIERLLYRLGQSSYAEAFILKGAQLFTLWFDTPHRPTRDLDLLYQGEALVPRLEAILTTICKEESTPPDGITFLADSVQGERIREDAAYEGVRIMISYEMASVRDQIQVDIGCGDAVTPAPQLTQIPSLLDFPAAQLRAYPPETVIAEKFEAMVFLGIANSRMRDFYDLWVLARESSFDGKILAAAIHATFRRRKTPLPQSLPLALSPEFGQDALKQEQWTAFMRKGRLRGGEISLSSVTIELQRFLMPLLSALSSGEAFDFIWTNKEGWRPRTA